MTALLVLKIAVVLTGAVIGLFVGLRLERHEATISVHDLETMPEEGHR